jgi:hypothetical protein
MRVSGTLEGYSCSQAGCNHHYTIADGHFRLVNGRKEIKNVKRCPECTAHQYLAKRGEINLDTIWLCPNPACPSKQH